jgi:hypothetical protein
VHLGVALGEVVHDHPELLLAHLGVDEGVVARQRVVEQRAAQRRLQREAAVRQLGRPLGDAGVAQPDRHLRLQRELTAVERHQRLGDRAERPALAQRAFLQHGQEVDADDHVLRRHRDRSAVGRLQDVVRRQHQDPRLGLGLGGQRQVHRHLVTVEVRVER